MSEHEEKKGEGSHGEESHDGGGHGGGGHAGGHEEHHEGAPEWLISFADNVALIMGFFVILLAMNMGPKAEPKQGGAPSDENTTDGGQSAQTLDMIIAIREGFNTPVNMKSTDPKESALRKRMAERGSSTTQGPRGDSEKQQAPRPSDFDRVTAAIPFDDKSGKLTDDARTTIAEVAAKQKDQRWVLEIRGHASPFEAMHNPTKALDLSYERAKAVATTLVEFGMKWDAIRVVGMGDGDRVVARTFDRQQDRNNQRVEIVITNYPVSSDPYSAPKDGT